MVGDQIHIEEQTQKPELQVGNETLSQFFDKSKRNKPVTRQQLLRILALYTQKVDVHEAMKVLEFGLRQSLRRMIAEERKVAEEADKKLIIAP